MLPTKGRLFLLMEAATGRLHVREAWKLSRVSADLRAARLMTHALAKRWACLCTRTGVHTHTHAHTRPTDDRTNLAAPIRHVGRSSCAALRQAEDVVVRNENCVDTQT